MIFALSAGNQTSVASIVGSGIKRWIIRGGGGSILILFVCTYCMVVPALKIGAAFYSEVRAD